MKDVKRANLKNSVKTALIDLLSILHLILMYLGAMTFIVLFEPNAKGLEFIIALLAGLPILFIAGGIAIFIFLKKEKNLFNKISSILTLSVIGLLIISSVGLFIVQLFTK